MYNPALFTNAYVYIVAEYYQIPELRDLAVTKFREASMKVPHLPGFEELVSLVYESEELSKARELRSSLSSLIVRSASLLIKDKPFMEVCVRIPDLVGDILPELVIEKMALLKRISDSMTLQKITKEQVADAVEAEGKLREQFADMRQKVNDAGCCRHCGKECNVHVKEEIWGWSLRCSCKTRY